MNKQKLSYKQPRNETQAAELCERLAALEGAVGAIDQARERAIARVNAKIDAMLLPKLDECDQIREKLKPWWLKAGDSMLSGKRKSMELGGCVIGFRKVKDKIEYQGDLKKPVDAFSGLRWAKKFIRETLSVDANAVLSAIDGKQGVKLKELGFEKVPGEDEFFVKRAEQKGTVDKVQS